jgi:hypothetical protein
MGAVCGAKVQPRTFSKTKKRTPSKDTALNNTRSWYVLNKFSNSAFSRSGVVLTSAPDTAKVNKNKS